MNLPLEVLYVSGPESLAIFWALDRALSSSQWVRRMRHIDRPEQMVEVLGQLDPSCGAVLFDLPKDQLDSWLWDVVRVQSRSRIPCVAMGYEPLEILLREPHQFIFHDRPYEYRYLPYPWRLRELIHVLRELQPVYDDQMIDSHVRRYCDRTGLVNRAFHDIVNPERREWCCAVLRSLLGVLPLDDSLMASMDNLITALLATSSEAETLERGEVLRKEIIAIVEGQEHHYA